MPKLIIDIDELIQTRLLFDVKQERIALVPTMGAIHEGHLSLLRRAKDFADLVFVSVFVNPLQFSPQEDFNAYPRDLERDLKLLKGNCDYVFAPEKEKILENIQEVKVDESLSSILCGLSRPGHFDGVLTIVKKLFELVRPHYAIFGEKDFQQLKVIQEMVTKEKIDCQIISAPTKREKNGLALSSRNQYLSEEEKETASNLYKELEKLEKEFGQSTDSSRKEELIKTSSERLESLGFRVEYLEEHWNRIFVAARLRNTRLIDNIFLKKD
jgi:pantoate--beta-alanine ligase